MYKANINSQARNGEGTPLHYATTLQDIPVIKLLLERGADANLTNDDGLTPLHIAVKKGK